MKPIVSIICLTYNHEPYLRDCLEGFVMQQTSFPFEVLVYDDASLDRTADIIREYVAKYPNLIKSTLYEKNNYQQGLGYVGFYTGVKEARGKYIAYCEGDDYWTDPKKLQKQVDFLENHLDYEICAHETLVKYEVRESTNDVLFSHTNINMFLNRRNRTEYGFKDALTGNIFHISSLMYRNRDLQLPQWKHEISAGDMILFMLLAEKGKIYVLPDVMSVYRQHSDSLSNSSEEFQKLLPFLQLSVNVLLRMNEYWNRKYEHLIFPIVARYYVKMEFLYLSKSYRNYTMAKKMARLAFSTDVLASLKYSMIESFAKLKKHL